MVALKHLAETIPPLSLGIALLLSWSYLLSACGLSCPSLDGSLALKTVLVPLGLIGALFWALLLLIASTGCSIRKPLNTSLVLATILALFVSLFANTSLPLAATTLLVTLCWLRNGVERLFAALLVGICINEALLITYLLLWAAGTPTPLSVTWPLHFSLYCYLTPVIPPLVTVSLLSPLLHPILRKNVLRVQSLSFLGSKKILAASASACLMLWFVLYASSLNPGVRLIGVDSVIRYYPHALDLLTGGVMAVIRIGYDRPLYYLILLGLAALLGPFEAVKILPLLSLLLYSVACYLAARELWGKQVAGLAALLAPFSYTTTVGLFGGLFNNWFSLSLALLAVAALARWYKTGNNVWQIMYLLSLAMSAVAHIYMGAVIFAVLTVLLIKQIATSTRRSGVIILIVAQLLLFNVGLIFLDALIRISGESLPSRILHSLANHWFETMLNRPLFSATWWSDLSFAVFNYAATAALDPTVWVLTTIAVAVIGPHGLPGSLVTLWLAITAALAFFAPADYIFRALFDFPYPIAEAFAAAYIADLIEKNWGMRTSTLWLVALLLFKIAYTVTFVCGLAVGG